MSRYKNKESKKESQNTTEIMDAHRIDRTYEEATLKYASTF